MYINNFIVLYRIDFRQFQTVPKCSKILEFFGVTITLHLGQRTKYQSKGGSLVTVVSGCAYFYIVCHMVYPCMLMTSLTLPYRIVKRWSDFITSIYITLCNCFRFFVGLLHLMSPYCITLQHYIIYYQLNQHVSS